MKHSDVVVTARINREPLTRVEDVRFSLATWLMRVAVYVVAPAKKRGNLDLLFSLGATAYAAERERQVREEFYARSGGLSDPDLHRERERATGDSDGKDGA